MPLPLMAIATIGASVISALTYKTPSRQMSSQEIQFAETVERYKRIAERRQAAITIASSMSGLPESTFYGRRGGNLLRSDTIRVGQTAATQPAAIEAVKQYEADLDAGSTKEAPAAVKQYETAPTYSDAIAAKSDETNAALASKVNERAKERAYGSSLYNSMARDEEEEKKRKARQVEIERTGAYSG